ncbi:hypothetical protein [Streptomyces sp. NPDC048392]|uniref:hypothetical protein n=1 Tax=Streptomyces sp. NPDC048392 TaxID=3365543 RepID=UPI003724AB56
MRALKAVLPVLALVAVTAACSSSDDADEQRLAERRENYCAQLGAWQKARNTAATNTPEPSGSGYDEVGGAAQNAFRALRHLRDESVGGGRTLGEATAAAMNNADSGAEALVVEYCGDVGFETLTR